MEGPTSASLGAMGSLLRKLDVLLASGCRLPEAVKDVMDPLKYDLEEINACLEDLSEVEDPPLTAKCWMKEVRELSYDIEDYIDEFVRPVRANINTRFACKISNVKITRLPKRLKRHQQIANMISEFRIYVQEAIERHERYELHCCTFRRRFVSVGPMLPTPYEETAELVIDGRMNEFINSLANDGDQQLKVVSIVGPECLGKTTLAKMLYNKFGGQFDCRAFIRVSRKPDMKRLFCDMLSQVQRQPPPDDCKELDLIDNIWKHLQDKRYLIIIDDLWAASVWDIINRAFPEGSRRSRIITTTQIEDVALTCCCYRSEYVFEMKPLDDDHSRKLFFNRLFGSESDCPQQFKEIANKTVEICGGLPLATLHIASLLESQPVILLELWMYLCDSLSSDLRTNSTSERMRQVLNLSFNNLPHHLKTCLLYLNMYPEGHTICKDDLVKQWVAEGFIDRIEGRDMEKVAGSYFDELIHRRFIQPIDINYNDEVLSCTVHDVVRDLIAYKSVEENFIVVVDYYRRNVEISDKVRRLSLCFGNAKYAKTHANIRTSQVRSLTCFGLFKCMPSITECKRLRVLNLQLSGHHGDDTLDLTGISELFQLRYLKISCNICIELPNNMRGLQCLETLDMDTKVTAIPWDIIHIPRLLHVRLPVETNLLDCIGSMRSVSEQSLGSLTNLRDLHLTCSTPPSDHLERNMEALGSLLGVLGNLKTLALVPGYSHKNVVVRNASEVIVSWDYLAPPPLQRFEWLPQSCIFSRVPKWIGELVNLCILKIAVRELLTNGVNILKGLPALTALSLYVQTAPAERIVFDKAGFSVIKYFKFKCSVPWLKFEADAMPNLRKLVLGFNALGVDQHRTAPISIEYLPGLKEISAKIGGAGSDADSALAIAVSSHPRNPRINVQCRSLVTKEKEYGTLEEQDEILEEDPDKHHGTQDGESGEDENKQAGSMARREQEHGTLVDQDKIMEDDPDEDSGEDENKQTGRRISTLPESSWHLLVPGSDAYSALAIAVSSHPRNPRMNVQGRSMVTKEEEYGTLEEQDEILEEDPDKHYGTQDGKSGEDENKQAGSMARQEQEHGTLIDQDKITEDDPDEDSGEDENKRTGRRISTLPESSSRLLVPGLKEDESKPAIVEDAMVSASTGAINSLPTKLATLMGGHSLMVETVVSASVGVMKPLLAKLTTLMGDEYKKLKDVRKEVVFLVDELSAMEAFLEKTADADELDPQVKNWRNHVREMAYDIEDCIDDFMYQLGGARVRFPSGYRGDDGNLGLLQKAVSYIKTWKDRHRIANQIQEMKARVIQASDRRKRYKLDKCITNSSSVDVDPRLSALYKESASLVGIDGPREELIEWVTDKGQQLKVVSVVGFGGLGKTTLANEVYRKIGGHFDCKAFVSVSLRPDMTRLLNALLTQLGLKPSPHACDMPDLINNLREYLQHKRYFVIVDDLWDVPAWDIIRCAFPENNQGSRVIITTRNEVVARSCSDNGYIYKMEPLSHSDSRRLFFNRIFRSEDACPSQFKEVSAEILKKCGGLPLAIITISGLLASQPTRLKEQWEYIRNSLGSQFATNPTLEGMRQILNLSYKNLPPHLKTCLLYLGMYPEDHEIRRNDLLRRWMAEGFVSALQGRDLVDVAKSYFNELLNRSLIQPKKTLRNDEVVSCGVHDMMLDLILSRCAEDNFVSAVYDPQFMQELRDKVRRLSLNLNDAEDGTIPVTTTNLSQVRSLALFRKSSCILTPLLDFKFLRVLAIEFSSFVEVKSRLDLTGITRLFQLKYLKISAVGGMSGSSESDCSIQLPTQIGGLRHLETLDMCWLWVNCIPTDIADLPRLMHLIVDVIPPGPRLPDRIGNMESLRTLRGGFDMTDSSLDSIKGLGELKNLRVLELSYDGRSPGARMDALLLDGSRVMSDDVLSSWSAPPPRHLEVLVLPALSFSRVPRCVGDLRNLWDLELTIREVLEDDVRLLGDLPSLTKLCLIIPQVPAERIVISGMGFPALKLFEFGCNRMSYLTFMTGAMPTLQTLCCMLFMDMWDHNTPGGIEHLLGLNNIYLFIKTSENTTPSEREAAETAFRSAAQLHPNSPAFM